MNEKKIIYLADDDEDDRQIIKEAIAAVSKEIVVLEAVDGQDLLQKIAGANTVSLFVILDMNMPKLNGLEALKAIRSDSRTKAVPIVMLSTSSTNDWIKQAYDLGVNAYIKKPTHYDDYIKVAQAIKTCFLEI